MGKPVLTQMSALVDLGDNDVGPLPDLQSQAVVEANSEVAFAREKLLNEVLFDLSEQEKREKIDMLLTHHAEVIDHWRRAGKHYLGAGRALLEIRRKLPLCAVERLLDSYDKNQRDGVNNWSALPFSQDTALRLMKVAEMVITGRFEVAFKEAGQKFDESLLPPYTVTYEYSKLPEDHLPDAVRAGLIRPDVPKREVIDFVASFKRSTTPKNSLDFHRRLGKIDGKLRKLYAEAQKLESERRDLIASGQGGLALPAPERRDIIGTAAPERSDDAEEQVLDAA